jgi:hypothetical protein
MKTKMVIAAVLMAAVLTVISTNTMAAYAQSELIYDVFGPVADPEQLERKIQEK